MSFGLSPAVRIKRISYHANLLIISQANERPNNLLESYLLGPAWLAILADTNMIPMYYYQPSQGDLVDRGLPSDNPYSLNHSLSVGRIIGFSKTQLFMAHTYIHTAERRDADGDELGYLLLLDGFLNFSMKYLPESRGSTMDAPLVLTTIIRTGEVDDQAFNLGIQKRYSLEFYNAALEYKPAYTVQIKVIANVLETKDQYENIGYTHETDDFNNGVLWISFL